MTIVAARTAIYDVLVAALGDTVDVRRFAAPTADVGDRVERPRVELGLFGTGDEPDLVTVRLLVTVGAEGGPARAEAALDELVDDIDAALPATVTAPEWAASYDVDRKQWTATGTAEAFR